jgi:MFS family permease
MIRDTFGIPADVTAWVATAYMLPFMLFMPLYGRLGDELGKRRLFLIGLFIFMIGTLITPFSSDLRFLLLGRIIQGIGTSGISPLCIALISEYFPVHTRGKALGTWNSVGPLAGIVGPLLGGILVDFAGWRTVFGPIFLLGLLSLFIFIRQIPPTPPKSVRPDFFRTFDWGGVILLSMTATLLIFYTSSRPITGIEAFQDWRLLLGALILLGSFVVWERQKENPFITLSLFRNKHFRLAAFGSGIRMFTMTGIGFLIPLYLTDIYALNATSIGVFTTLHAAALLVTLRIGGQLADSWRSRWPVLLGSSMQVGAALYFSLLPGSIPSGYIVLGLAGHGLGAGLTLAAFHRGAMGRITQKQLGVAAGLYGMIRFGVGALGVALGGVLLQYGLSQSFLTIDAYQLVFRFIAVVAFFGVVIAWRLKA